MKSSSQIKYIFVIAAVLSFCSIVYELILAQALSAFLSNTVLRYSVTIGLYMCSLGFGSLLAEKRFTQKPIQSLLAIELLLTLVGGGALVWMYFLDAFGLSRFTFSLSAHLLIIVIGILSGFELPLLMEMIRQENTSVNIVLAFNYLGAFVGTVLFAFLFYPVIGLVPSAFLVGSLNACSGLTLYAFRKTIPEKEKMAFFLILLCSALLLGTLLVCLFLSKPISEYLTNLYLK
jgi:spermidine synthase